MSTFCLYFRALFGTFFLKVSLFGCNNDRLFSEKYTVKDYISNTKLEKGDHYYIKHGTRIFSPITILLYYHPIILLKSN